MTTKTEKARRLPGLPTTDERSNGSIAQESVGKTDVCDGFTKLPNAVLLNSSLSAVDCRLYALLAHHQGSNAESWPSQKLLVAELDVSESTVRRGLRRLEAAELVKTRQVGLRRTNRYTVLNPGSVTTDDAQQGCSANPVNMPDRSRVTVPRVRRTSRPASSSLLSSTSISSLRSELSAEARRVECQVLPYVSGSVFEELEEQQEPAARPQPAEPSSSNLLSHDTSFIEYFELLGSDLAALALDSHYDMENNDLGLVGEPPRPVAKQRQVTNHTTGGERMAETEEMRSKREFKEREAAGVCVGCAGSDGLEIYRSCLYCTVCREGHRKIDERLDRELAQIRAAKAEAAGGLPWEAAPSPEPPPLRDTARPVKEPAPWDSQSEHDAWKRHVEDQARSGPEATEPPEADTDRVSEELLPWESIGERVDELAEGQGRIERKLDELPVSVAIAVGGHPAEEAGQILAGADERPM